MRIKNWQKFQHYKHRSPPWIKLYRELLDDKQWHDLDGDSAKTLVMLWLIAAENDGYLPASKVLAFRLRTSERAVERILVQCSHWFEGDASNPQADCKQDATPETEKSRDRVETETETESGASAPSVSFHEPEIVPIGLWLSFVEHRKGLKKPLTPHAGELVRRKLLELKNQGYNPVTLIETAIERGWVTVFEPKPEEKNGNGKHKPSSTDLANRNAKALWPHGRTH
jgi:hypothetical protein